LPKASLAVVKEGALDELRAGAVGLAGTALAAAGGFLACRKTASCAMEAAMAAVGVGIAAGAAGAALGALSSKPEGQRREDVYQRQTVLRNVTQGSK